MKIQVEKELFQEMISQLKTSQAGAYYEGNDVIKRADEVLVKHAKKKDKNAILH